MDDVYATNGNELVEQYGRGLIDDLLRFAEGRDRARLVNAFEVWKQGGVAMPPDIRELLWSKVYQAAATPPDDPAELVRIIKMDRLFREGRVLRSIGLNDRSVANIEPNKRKREIDMTDRNRIDENSTITIATEEGKNPKRAGSKAFDAFALYSDGMTVKEAKAAGISATDIAYNVNKGYITLTPGEPVEGAEEAAEDAPKKKSRSKKAAADDSAEAA